MKQSIQDFYKFAQSNYSELETSTAVNKIFENDNSTLFSAKNINSTTQYYGNNKQNSSTKSPFSFSAAEFGSQSNDPQINEKRINTQIASNFQLTKKPY